jgi:hypothetical protein
MISIILISPLINVLLLIMSFIFILFILLILLMVLCGWSSIICDLRFTWILWSYIFNCHHFADDDYSFEYDFETDDEQELYVSATLIYLTNTGYSIFYINQHMFLHYEGWRWRCWGGISLAGTWWDKEALALAEQVSASFDDDLKIYAFKTAANLTIRVRIEKMSTWYSFKSKLHMMDNILSFD